jgi:hypothetical protein
MIKKCKNCFSSDLREFKNYKYQFDEDSEIVHINGFICAECKCIHSIKDNELEFWSYMVDDSDDKVDAIDSWATDYDVKMNNIKNKENVRETEVL